MYLKPQNVLKHPKAISKHALHVQYGWVVVILRIPPQVAGRVGGGVVDLRQHGGPCKRNMCHRDD